jgi:predicted  nucleic acid-binding Zn-ribbon protein
MKLELLISSVESRLFGLGRSLLQADVKSELREELEHAQAELSAREAALASAVARRDDMRQRVKTYQSESQRMPAEIESSFRRGKKSQALRQALELETIRRNFATAQADLCKLEQTVWCLCFNLRQLRRRVERIREQISQSN